MPLMLKKVYLGIIFILAIVFMFSIVFAFKNNGKEAWFLGGNHLADDKLLPKKGYCQGDTDEKATTEEQEISVFCLINAVRENYNLLALKNNSMLDKASESKARDIIKCSDFSHTACGREFTYHLNNEGFKVCNLDKCAWGVGENLAWSGGYTDSSIFSPREIVNEWLHSPKHRDTLLSPQWNEQGLYALKHPFDGKPKAIIWVSSFAGKS